MRKPSVAGLLCQGLLLSLILPNSVQAGRAISCSPFELAQVLGKILKFDDAKIKQIQDHYQSPRVIEGKLKDAGLEAAFYSRSPTLVNRSAAVGDIAHVKELGDGRVSIFLGDVESHGNKSAVGTLHLHKMMDDPDFVRQAYFGPHGEPLSPSDTLAFIDSHYKYDHQLTLNHIILDTKTGKLQYADAMNVPFFIRRAKDKALVMLTSDGLWISHTRSDEISYANMPHSTTNYQLEPGDTIISFTDGFWDGHFKGKKNFVGDLRIPRSLRNDVDDDWRTIVEKLGHKLSDPVITVPGAFPDLPTSASPKQIVDYLVSIIQPAIDDRSMIAIRYSGPKP